MLNEALKRFEGENERMRRGRWEVLGLGRVVVTI